ncbi:glycosyltransferase [Candidatus Pelagibacter sp.]|uniref:glycosyltransferase n=1 Tax=Candidatus Pelagibacter sp. TaxID=2024849 RepID=UPI003F878F87|tara:strand:- start:83 stop:763 length:681 start_codon:yes stop_codon:yes gene_type:complete
MHDLENLTLIIPARYEADSLPITIKEIQSLYNVKIKVVLQKEDIETIKSIQELDVEILNQPKKGYGDALIYGISKVQTRFFSIFNADGSFNPREIINMKNKLEYEKLDLVFGSRYLKNAGSEDDTFLTFIGNKFFTFFGNFLFQLNISDILYTFVLGDTRKVNELFLESYDFRLCVELPVVAKKRGLKISDFPCYERPRIAGFKKVNEFKDGFLILLKLLMLKISK